MLGRVALYSIFMMSVFALTVILVLIEYSPLFQNDNLPAQALTPGSLTTGTWGIFDPDTGKLFAGGHEDLKGPIASLTKLFTAAAVMESPRQYEPFIISSSDVATEGRAGKLTAGTRTTPYNLLFPLLIESSNDAGEAIRRHLGKEFTDSVTTLRGALSLQDTNIVDASGLSTLNVSTVSDISRFYAYLRESYPHMLDITQLNMYIGNGVGYVNNNPGRSFRSFTGGKNGYTAEAGRTFVGTFRLPDTGAEIGIVLLGSTDIVRDLKYLLAHSEGFKSDF
jgi:D-alanyl-D-alanine carboxypeptidase